MDPPNIFNMATNIINMTFGVTECGILMCVEAIHHFWQWHRSVGNITKINDDSRSKLHATISGTTGCTLIVVFVLVRKLYFRGFYLSLSNLPKK